MTFESLSETYEFVLGGFPHEWLPLTYLYDPDLPLFPICYFHVLDPQLAKGRRPGERDRAFGFIHHIAPELGGVRVTVATNKNLAKSQYAELARAVREEVGQRLGLLDPVTIESLSNALDGELKQANAVLTELWYQVLDGAFGKKLPFGKLWDPVFGLARFVASFNSDGGRKGELIQTHFFSQEFGVRIPSGGGIHADFYLLPTYAELRDTANPLAFFPRFSDLLSAAAAFASASCDRQAVGAMMFSAFRPQRVATAGQLNTQKLLSIFKRFGKLQEQTLISLYNAFNRGPARSVLALMMVDDLRQGRWDAAAIGSGEASAIYTELKGSYQSPKVIHLYSQQCFGNNFVLPIDTWIKAFLRWPLGFPQLSDGFHAKLFDSCAIWGKVERLIWMAVQARKVHSSTCESILWCIRYGDADGHLRGASPLACKICAKQIRDVCPAFARISSKLVSFNKKHPKARFMIETSARNNTAPAQDFVRCKEIVPSGEGLVDEYSVRDRAKDFEPYPRADHTNGSPLTVAEFIARY